MGKRLLKSFHPNGSLEFMAFISAQGLQVRVFDADGTEKKIQAIKEMDSSFLIEGGESFKAFSITKKDLNIEPKPDLKELGRQAGTNAFASSFLGCIHKQAIIQYGSSLVEGE